MKKNDILAHSDEVLTLKMTSKPTSDSMCFEVDYHSFYLLRRQGVWVHGEKYFLVFTYFHILVMHDHITELKNITLVLRYIGPQR